MYVISRAEAKYVSIGSDELPSYIMLSQLTAVYFTSSQT